MKEDKTFTEIRYQSLKHDGVNDPLKVDNFVEEVYTLMKERNFSIIEATTIVKYLSDKIEHDKKIILREPLTNVTKYNEDSI